MTAKELRDIARRSLDNMGVTGARYRVEEMLEWKVADRIEALEAELAAAKADLDSLCCELATILGAGTAPSGVTRVAYWIGRVGEAIGKVESERDSARAEVERLTALVKTAFVDALIFVAGWDADLAAEKWNDSDAKKALEVTT